MRTHLAKHTLALWRRRRLALAVALALALIVPLRAALVIAVGDAAPDFTALDQDNEPFTLSDQAGKVVLLHICAGWCGPCQRSAQAEAQLVAGIDADIGADNWVLVDALIEDFVGGLSTAASATTWRTALATPARTLHVEGSTSSGLYQMTVAIQLAAFPTYLVISPDGTIAYIQEGWSGNEPLHDEVVAAWYAHQTPETQLQALLAELGESGVEGALAAKLNAAYALITDDDPDNDPAVVNVLRAVLRQVEAQAGKALSEEQAASVTAIVQQIAGGLQGT